MKKTPFFAIIVGLCLICFLVSGEYATSITTDKILVLEGGTLIDGTGDAPVFDAVLIIKNGYITDMGSMKSTEVPEGAMVIPLKGETILPGFINAHIHNGYNEHNLKTWAFHGVTTVRDLGGDPKNNLFSFRDKALKNPQLARLIAAGPMITVPGGYPKIPWGSPAGLPITSPDDARDQTIRLLDEGADIIKIALESGERFQREIPVLSLEEAKAIVEVAHRRGTIVSAHVLVAKDLERALEAGVDDIAHMVTDDPSDDLIQRVVRQGIYWVPTLELWHGVGYGLGDVAINNLRRFVMAKGLVALGTDFDGYNCPFDLGMPIREVRWMKEAGMTPMQIIVAATKNASRVCNLEDSIGTLEKGKIADILVVKGDPLDDLEALLNPRMVIRGGQIIRDEQ
ncbi:MAG: amidohydrolase family protein [Candidatus Aminicenantes bacterium]|nr:MAG: amidohydrolase family protein [Candidatus Aminicenantes bacterium]